MEKLKQQLIELLGENARYTYSQLAAITGAEEQAIVSVVKQLETDGAKMFRA